jgi:uridine kinase
MPTWNASDPYAFSGILFERMKRINPAIESMEPYEFRYGLDNLCPKNGGWASVKLEPMGEIEKRIGRSDFYSSIQVKPRVDDRIVLDQCIVSLTNMLLVGLATGAYPLDWITAHFNFDLRGFYFLTRITYFTDAVLAHLGVKPLKVFERKQKCFERCQSIGYKQFKQANAQVDQFFMESVAKLIAARGTPVLIAIAGGTAAGKTEIVERLRNEFGRGGLPVTSIELDNFFTDREYREAKGIDSLGKEAYHFQLFLASLEDIMHGKRVVIPRYDTIDATSSHDLNGNLKPGRVPIEIEPADITFIEGNFPFLLPEVAHLIGIKVVYLTDDAVRLKRKWRRDIDYRKKYEPNYFRNRYFKDQFLMAQKCYIPQMQICDMVVDTTGAALWTTPEISALLRQGWIS